LDILTLEDQGTTLPESTRIWLPMDEASYRKRMESWFWENEKLKILL